MENLMANVAPVINLPGNLDILATTYANNVVWDLFGDGTGKFAFATPSSISVGTNPTVVAPGDINNDGRLDFVTVNAGSGTVSVMLGNGAGGFTAAAGSPITVGGADGQSIALGDVNGDGNLDIVSSNTDAGTLSVLLGNGTGGFIAEGSPFAVGTGPQSVALADVNGDGRLDIVTANWISNNVSILLRNAGAGFTSTAPTFVSGAPFYAALADMNGDGRIDIVTANRTDGTATVLIQQASLGFVGLTPVNVGTNPQWVAVGDLNDDGKLDFVTANTGSNNLSVMLANSGGGYSAAGATLSVTDSPTSVALGDVNHDGKLDIIETSGTTGHIGVLLGNGSGGFSGAAGSPLLVNSPTMAALAYVNDVKVTSAHVPLVFSAAHSNAITLSDVDAAGGTETLSLSALHGVLTLATTAGLTINSGANGSGALQVTGTLANLNAALDGLSYSANNGFNGDDTLTLSLNDNGHTGTALTTTSRLALSVVNVPPTHNFNGDGKSDILWQSDDGTPAVWLMDGTNATSVGAVGFNPGSSWHVMGAADFNGDSKSDILWQIDNGTPVIWTMDDMNVLSIGAAGSFNPGSDWHVII
jgi:hypothetical protein